MMKHLVVAVPSLLVACGVDVPAKPTYFGDVQPILRANCVRCHGADPIDPKVAEFRLDRYVRGETSTFDVYDYATGTDPVMARVVVDGESPAMPPDYELSDRQREIIALWIARGAPKGMRDNHAPQIELIAPGETATADQSLDVTFRAWDADLDGLVVQLWASDLTVPEDVALGAQSGGGQRTLAIDTGTLASKHRFEIYAIVDDGFFDDPALNRSRVTLIPDVLIDHGIRGTAPTVKVVTPNSADTLIDSASIRWTATDPDTDPNTGAPDVLAIELALIAVAGDGTTTMAASIANDLPNTGSFSWQIPATIPARDASGNSIQYRIRVTATDTLGIPPNVRSDDSDVTFTIEHGATTTYTWADIQPLMDKYCKECHGEPARSVALDDFCLLQYEAGEAVPPCEASDVGTFEMKGSVYTRTVQAKTMPPQGQPQPTQAERDKIGSWILGGAPYGSGPSDMRPTFTWTAPGSSVLDASASGTAMLQWTVADAEALAADRIESAKVTGAPNCGNVSCSTVAVPSWSLVTMSNVSGMSQLQAFAWPRPSTGAGCYCLRGTVTDAATQSTTVIANKPVRF